MNRKSFVLIVASTGAAAALLGGVGGYALHALQTSQGFDPIPAAQVSADSDAGPTTGVTEWGKIVLIRGTLRPPSGVVAAGDGFATVHAWPSNSVLAELAVGEEAKMMTLAAAAVSADGSFELRLPETTRIGDLPWEGDAINMTLDAEFAGTRYSYDFSATLDDLASEQPIETVQLDPLSAD